MFCKLAESEMAVLMNRRFGHECTVGVFANNGEVKGFKGAGIVVLAIATSDDKEVNTQAARDAIEKINNIFLTLTDAPEPELQDHTKE